MIVPGIIGCLQALEVQKIALGLPVLSQKQIVADLLGEGPYFRTFNLRPRRRDCLGCRPVLPSEVLLGLSIPTPTTCLLPSSFSLLPQNRISCEDYRKYVDRKEKHLLLDVREPIQFEICSLPQAKNIPLLELEKKMDELEGLIRSEGDSKVMVICRRGIHSVEATRMLVEHGISNVCNIDGGLTSWQKTVDPLFPLY
eukprot:TRINITY_DN5016_c0_g1_i2.p1 TRINITY_DN5016_c0_g1~~TRINITY_DN5016_c0_g1_i2.p1  ORF type:complete len:198 (+),score=37.40 TRINITY_DN5016_c0_g1_i2:208-801(+)